MTALRIDSGAAPLRRRLGPVPWFVLEELVLLAGADSVVETNVRALAAGLSLNKDTVARALGRLRAEGLVASDPQPNEAGRFGRGQYQTGAVLGLQRLDDEQPHARSIQPRTPTAVPHPTMSLQLSLIDDGVDDDAAHSDPLRLTSAGEDDALAPGVRSRAAPVPPAARDGGGRALC